MTAPVFGLAVGLFRTPRPGTSTQAIYRHGVVLLPCSERAKATAFPQHLNSLPCPVGQLVNAAPTFHSSSVMLINDFRPSHPTKTFGLARSAEPPPAVVPVLSSTLLPGLSAMDGVNAVFCRSKKTAKGRNFITTTASSATSHPLQPWLSPWSVISGITPDAVSGFPGYCTGSLSTMPPSSTAQV